MKISIIIITYNGTLKLPRLLLSINSIPSTDFEVIIIDDGSRDNPLDVVSALTLNYNWRLVSQENKGRATAKNVGAKLAKYEMLWFLDDDMKITSDSMNAHISHHLNFPRSISVGSQLEENLLGDSDIQKYKVYLSEIWQKAIESYSNPLSIENLYITSANFTVSRNLFFELGGFHDGILDAEDLDLAYRCYLEKIFIFYNKNSIGYHKDKITCKSYVLRNRQYVYGYDVLKNLKPIYTTLNKRLVLEETTGVKRLVYGIIGQPFFVYLIDNFNLFLLLPQRIRYKFYEALIYSLGRVFINRNLINK
ncbi:MAG: glycosyltransferase family 2 protein [Bacteroidia bacterium]